MQKMAWLGPVPSRAAGPLDSGVRASASISALASEFKRSVSINPNDSTSGAGVSSSYLAVLQRENERVRVEEAARSAAGAHNTAEIPIIGRAFAPASVPQGVPGSSSTGNSSSARAAPSPLLVCRDAIGASPHADRPWLEGLDGGPGSGRRRSSLLAAPSDALSALGRSFGMALGGLAGGGSAGPKRRGSSFLDKLTGSSSTRSHSSGASTSSLGGGGGSGFEGDLRCETEQELRQRLAGVKQDMQREMGRTAEAAASLAKRAARCADERHEELRRLAAWGLGVCVPDVSLAWDLRVRLNKIYLFMTQKRPLFVVSAHVPQLEQTCAIFF